MLYRRFKTIYWTVGEWSHPSLRLLVRTTRITYIVVFSFPFEAIIQVFKNQRRCLPSRNCDVGVRNGAVRALHQQSRQSKIHPRRKLYIQIELVWLVHSQGFFASQQIKLDIYTKSSTMLIFFVYWYELGTAAVAGNKDRERAEDETGACYSDATADWLLRQE